MAGDKGDNYETISNIEVKYLKDNEGKIISPIVSSESVFCPGEDAMLKDKIDNIDTKLVAASQSQAGFMSAEDKTKLDGITASADSVSFSRSLSAGTKVGTLTINGTGTDLYAPTPPSGVNISSVATTSTGTGDIHFNPHHTVETDITMTASAGYYPVSVFGYCSGVTLEKLYISSGRSGSATIRYRMKNNSGNTAYIGNLTIYLTWIK